MPKRQMEEVKELPKPKEDAFLDPVLFDEEEKSHEISRSREALSP